MNRGNRQSRGFREESLLTEKWNRGLSTGKVAQALGLSNSTVQAYARDGLIPANTTPGGQYRFNLDEVLQVLAGEQLPAARPMPALDEGPGVVVSMRPEATGDERSTAFAELRGFLPAAPPETADDLEDYSLEGIVQQAPAAVTAYLQLR